MYAQNSKQEENDMDKIASRSWAASIGDAARPDELETLGVYQPGEIHPAHISNLASYCMRAGTGKGECR